jgi:hypothetical protein
MDKKEFAAMVADKQDNPTMHELAKAFPEKNYRELEIYRDADRQEEAQQISLTESQKKQDELEPIEKGACVIGEARKDREETNMTSKVKELEEALANALAINESHQKLNGRLQERVTELEEDNKKLAHEIEDRVNKMRKSGL